MLEVDAFFLTGTAQHKERQHRQHHTYPLIKIEPLAEYKHGSHKHHHRTRSINRPHNGKRQVFHSEISEYPRGEDDERLDDDKFMYIPSHHRNIEHRTARYRRSENRYQDKRKEYQTGKYRIQKQDRKYGIVFERLFLEGIIKSQQGCREEG